MDFCFNLAEEEYIPSRSIFSHLKIGFDFFFKYYTTNLDQDSPTTWLSTDCSYDRTFGGVIIEESLSYDDIREAVGGAISDRLPDPERDELIELACEEVRKRFPTTATLPDYDLIILSFDVGIGYRHVEVVESDMVPAADSSFAVLLEKYEVGGVDDDEIEGEKNCRCCICLEELLGGGELMRMPCSHVFHGGCVVKWLRRSHYCPLCRYQMPTE